MKTITKEYIESLIRSEFYFTAADGVLGASEMGCKPAGRADVLNRFTICMLVLENGHTILGESCCVNPAIYDKAKGEAYARENAIEKIWGLEGYLLRQRNYESRAYDWYPAKDADNA